MEPVSVSVKGNDYIITHKCQKCGKIIKQHSAPDDDIDTIIAISSNPDFIFGK